MDCPGQQRSTPGLDNWRAPAPAHLEKHQERDGSVLEFKEEKSCLTTTFY
jgi:hypothetical protein